MPLKGFDTLLSGIIKKNNVSVIGLDPRLEYIPDFIKEKFDVSGAEGAAQAVLLYNRLMIDSFFDIVPAIKPQSAYYEMMGGFGAATLEKTVSYAHEKGLFVILDGKRNDIGATSKAYAEAYLKDGALYRSDALTVNGYLGDDGILPFLDQCAASGGGIFALVKTSNPSSGQFQDLFLADGRRVYECMADMVTVWNEKYGLGEFGYGMCGAVAGATYPEELAALRKRMSSAMLLVPGYGAQGGGASGVAGAFDKNGLGAIVNSSRKVMCAWKTVDGVDNEESFKQATRAECVRMRDELNTVR